MLLLLLFKGEDLRSEELEVRLPHYFHYQLICRLFSQLIFGPENIRKLWKIIISHSPRWYIHTAGLIGFIWPNVQNPKIIGLLSHMAKRIKCSHWRSWNWRTDLFFVAWKWLWLIDYQNSCRFIFWQSTNHCSSSWKCQSASFERTKVSWRGKDESNENVSWLGRDESSWDVWLTDDALLRIGTAWNCLNHKYKT